MKKSILTKLQSHMFTHHPQEAVEQLELMKTQDAIGILMDQDEVLTKPIWRMLAKDILQNIFKEVQLPFKAKILNALPAQDLPLLWEPLSDDTKQTLLTLIDQQCKDKLDQLQDYPENTLGRIMKTNVVTLRDDILIKDALARIRKAQDKASRIVYVLDSNNKLAFYVEVAEMALSDTDKPITSIARPIKLMLHAHDQQEEIMSLLETADLKEVPVLDDDDRFLGIIKPSQIIQAAKEEAVSDIQTMVGVSRSETALSSVGFAIKRRLPWLEINLVTAFLAAAVVGLFEGTIAKYTALAVLLPIVAGQSGNTGAQTLAVTMRSLALNEITLKHTPILLFKEARVAFVNGIVIALTTGVAVVLWSKTPGLGFVIGVSMVISMVVAAVSGASVPLILTRLGQDPAQSSSIILTTVTDVAGFFSFLGIATSLSFML